MFRSKKKQGGNASAKSRAGRTVANRRKATRTAGSRRSSLVSGLDTRLVIEDSEAAEKRRSKLIEKAHGGPADDLDKIRERFGMEEFNKDDYIRDVVSLIELSDAGVLFKDLSERKKLTSGHLSKSVGENYTEFISMSRQVLQVESEMTVLHDELQRLSAVIKSLGAIDVTGRSSSKKSGGASKKASVPTGVTDASESAAAAADSDGSDDDDSGEELDETKRERALLELDKLDDDLTQLAQSQQLVLAVDLLLDCQVSRDWSILGPPTNNEAYKLFEEHLEILHQIIIRQLMTASTDHVKSQFGSLESSDAAIASTSGKAGGSGSSVTKGVSRTRTFLLLLIRLGFIDESMDLFLLSKSRQLQYEIRNIFLSGDIKRYISDLSNIFFANLIRTTFDYSALISEMKMIYSAGVSSAARQQDYYHAGTDQAPVFGASRAADLVATSSAAGTTAAASQESDTISTPAIAKRGSGGASDGFTQMSRLMVWMCHELEIFEELFEKQVFGNVVDHGLRKIGECLKLVYKQCDRLELCGVHVSFLLTAKFAPALRRQVDRLFDTNVTRIRSVLSEDWKLRLSRKNIRKSGGSSSSTAAGAAGLPSFHAGHSTSQSYSARHSRRESLRRLSAGSLAHASALKSSGYAVGSSTPVTPGTIPADSSISATQISVTDSGAEMYKIVLHLMNALWDLLHTPYYKGLTSALYASIMRRMTEVLNLYMAGIRQRMHETVTAMVQERSRSYRGSRASRAVKPPPPRKSVVDEDTKESPPPPPKNDDDDEKTMKKDPSPPQHRGSSVGSRPPPSPSPPKPVAGLPQSRIILDGSGKRTSFMATHATEKNVPGLTFEKGSNINSSGVGSAGVSGGDSKESAESSHSDPSAVGGLILVQQIALLCNYYFVSTDLCDRVISRLSRLFSDDWSNCVNQFEKLKESHSDLFCNRVIREFALLQLPGVRNALCLDVKLDGMTRSSTLSKTSEAGSETKETDGPLDFGADYYCSAMVKFDLTSVAVGKGAVRALAKLRKLREELVSWLFMAESNESDRLLKYTLSTVLDKLFESLAKDSELISKLSLNIQSIHGLRQMTLDLFYLSNSMREYLSPIALSARDKFLESVKSKMDPALLAEDGEDDEMSPEDFDTICEQIISKSSQTSS